MTASKRIYMQHIGRAFSAGELGEPMIFDVANVSAGLPRETNYSVSVREAIERVNREREEFGLYPLVVTGVEEHAPMDVAPFEKITLWPLVFFMVLLGILPAILLSFFNPTFLSLMSGFVGR
jgi:hypothetical protein